MEKKDYRVFDTDLWGEGLLHYILGAFTAMAVLLSICMLFRRLRRHFQIMVDEEKQEILIDIEADFSGVIFGANFARVLWFFILGFNFILRDYFTDTAVPDTPDVISVL